MNIQQLHIIREASRYAFNLTEVASVLGISQPAVSHQVRELEQELGITLFRRHGRRLLGLTPVGEEILTIVERVLNDIEAMLQIGKQHARTPARQLSLDIQATLASSGILHSLHTLPQRQSQFRLATSISGDALASLAKRLRSGELDLALTIHPTELPAELAFVPCRQVSLQLLFPSGHPLLSIESLNLFHIAAFPLIAPPDDDVVRQHISQAFTAAGLAEQVVLATRDPALIRHYVEQDLGIGVIPSLLDISPGPLVARDASALFASLELGLLYSPAQVDTGQTEPLIREIQRILRQFVVDDPLRKGQVAVQALSQFTPVQITDPHVAAQ